MGIQASGFRGKPLLDQYLSKVSRLKLKKEKVTLIYKGAQIDCPGKDWLEDIRLRLERAKQNLETLDKTDIGSADRVSIYNQVYSTLEDFLVSFFKLFLAARNEAIKIRGRSGQMEDWDLIKDSIRAYVKDKKISLKSYFVCVLIPFTGQIQSNYKMVNRKLFDPTESSIREAFKYLDEIIVYLSEEVDDLIKPLR